MYETNKDDSYDAGSNFGLRGELAFAKYVIWPARLALAKHYPGVMRSITAAESVAGFNEAEEFIFGGNGPPSGFAERVKEEALKLVAYEILSDQLQDGV